MSPAQSIHVPVTGDPSNGRTSIDPSGEQAAAPKTKPIAARTCVKRRSLQIPVLQMNTQGWQLLTAIAADYRKGPTETQGPRFGPPRDIPSDFMCVGSGAGSRKA